MKLLAQNIYGIGIDLIEIERIKNVYEKYGIKFLNRIYHNSEIKLFGGKRRFPRMALVFATKEAVMKAIGTGLRGGVSWKDIKVTFLKSGKPAVVLYGVVKEIVKDGRILVSMSDSKYLATSIVVWVSK